MKKYDNNHNHKQKGFRQINKTRQQVPVVQRVEITLSSEYIHVDIGTWSVQLHLTLTAMVGSIRTAMVKLKVRKAILANNPVDHYCRFFSAAVPMLWQTPSVKFTQPWLSANWCGGHSSFISSDIWSAQHSPKTYPGTGVIGKKTHGRKWHFFFIADWLAKFAKTSMMLRS